MVGRGGRHKKEFIALWASLTNRKDQSAYAKKLVTGTTTTWLLTLSCHSPRSSFLSYIARTHVDVITPQAWPHHHPP